MRRLIMLIVAFLVSLPVAAAALTLQWVVVDRDGALVGWVLPQGAGGADPDRLSDYSPVWVARRISGGWLRIPVTESAIRVTHQFPFLYENSDCSGPGWLEGSQEEDAVRATVIFDTDVFWSAVPAESRVIRSKGVLLRDGDGCQGTPLPSGLCCSPLEGEETRLVAEISGARVADLNLRPPFRLLQVERPSEPDAQRDGSAAQRNP